MTKGRSRIGGLFTAMITPFDSRGHVDSERTTRLVRFLVSKGVDGLYPCGSTGLGPMLQTEERKVVAEAVVKASAGKVPVVVQVGAADTQTTVELAKHAEEIGAYAVASLTPYYYKHGEKAVVKHFEAVSKAVNIPVLAYNIPQFTGNKLSPSTVASMAKSGTVSGIKDSSGDLVHLQDLVDAVPDDFVVMNGTEEYGLYAIMSGADGLVSGGSSALPEIFRRLVAAERGGRHAEAIEAQADVLRFKELVKAGPVSAYYSILKERGIDCGAPRPPFLPLDESDARKVAAGLEKFSL